MPDFTGNVIETTDDDFPFMAIITDEEVPSSVNTPCAQKRMGKPKSWICCASSRIRTSSLRDVHNGHHPPFPHRRSPATD